MLTNETSINNIAIDSRNTNKGENNMTVCLAAIAENGKRLVLAADDMIIIPVGNTILCQKEDKNCKKIIALNENIYALMAGSTYYITPVIREAKKEINPTTTPLDAANSLKIKLQNFYLHTIEDQFLKRFNYDLDFFKNHQQQINQTIIDDLYKKINYFNLDINVIVAGYDTASQNCYLVSVFGNGILLEYTADGFITNGSGGEMAKFSLISNNYSPSMELDKVKELVIKAIDDAKKTPGIGNLGELIVIPKINPPILESRQSPKRD